MKTALQIIAYINWIFIKNEICKKVKNIRWRYDRKLNLRFPFEKFFSILLKEIENILKKILIVISTRVHLVSKFYVGMYIYSICYTQNISGKRSKKENAGLPLSFDVAALSRLAALIADSHSSFWQTVKCQKQFSFTFLSMTASNIRSVRRIRPILFSFLFFRLKNWLKRKKKYR